MVEQTTLRLPAFSRGYHLITRHVEQALPALPEAGLLHVFIQHTSAAVTLNENADPSVRVDFETIMNRIVPEGLPEYTHTMEGLDDMPAHVKAALIGNSVTIPITRGALNLGTWQGLYLCEFRNHASGRKLVLTVMS